MKKGNIVKFLGATDIQVRWRNCDDPRPVFFVGHEYKVSKVEVHSGHTKIKLVDFTGMYNSVFFEVVR